MAHWSAIISKNITDFQWKLLKYHLPILRQVWLHLQNGS